MKVERKAMKINVKDGKADVYTPYNAEFVRRIKQIGGAKWNGARKCWTVPDDTVDVVRGVMVDVYGETDIPSGEKKLRLKITVLRDLDELRAPVSYFGKNIASAKGRDSGAIVGDGVPLIRGEIDSTGSARWWYSTVRKGVEIILSDVPEALYKRDKDAELFGRSCLMWKSLIALWIKTGSGRKKRRCLRGLRKLTSSSWGLRDTDGKTGYGVRCVPYAAKSFHSENKKTPARTV